MALTYRRKDGTEVPFFEWTKLGKGFSIRPSTRGWRVRYDATGEVRRPSGPASRAALQMGLYNDELPAGYLCYCFGPSYLADEDPALFSKNY